MPSTKLKRGEYEVKLRIRKGDRGAGYLWQR